MWATHHDTVLIGMVVTLLHQQLLWQYIIAWNDIQVLFSITSSLM